MQYIPLSIRIIGVMLWLYIIIRKSIFLHMQCVHTDSASDSAFKCQIWSVFTFAYKNRQHFIGIVCLESLYTVKSFKVNNMVVLSVIYWKWVRIPIAHSCNVHVDNVSFLFFLKKNSSFRPTSRTLHLLPCCYDHSQLICLFSLVWFMPIIA